MRREATRSCNWLSRPRAAWGSRRRSKARGCSSEAGELMARYVFRRKAGSTPSVRRLAERATALGARVVAQTDNMLHIESSEATLKKLNVDPTEFVTSGETRFSLPTPPRVRLRKHVR